MKYNIGNLQFKTKKECENYTRDLIKKIGCCKIKKDHEQFIFFNDLIKNHPEYDEKKGVGIKYFRIINNPLNRKTFHTIIKRKDNTKTNFSWVYCCQFKKRSPTFNLFRSMREAIKDDTIGFKRKQNILVCNYCKEKDFIYEYYHVDHHEPSFKKLRDDFLKSTKQKIPTSFDTCEKSKLSIFKDEDKEFKNEWMKFHRKKCNFQILCQDCNLKKSKD